MKKKTTSHTIMRHIVYEYKYANYNTSMKARLINNTIRNVNSMYLGVLYAPS